MIEFSQINELFALVGGGAYLILFLYLLNRRRLDAVLGRWFRLFLLCGAGWLLVHQLEIDIRFFEFLIPALMLLGIGFLAAVVGYYLRWQRPWMGPLLALLFIAIGIGIDFLGPASQSSWWAKQIPQTVGGIVLWAGWLLIGVGILVGLGRAYWQRWRGWQANQILYWLVMILLFLVGEGLLFASWDESFLIFAHFFRFIAVIGLSYAVIEADSLDIRIRIQKLLASGTTLLLLAGGLTAILLITQIEVGLLPVPLAAVLFFTLILAGFIIYPFLRKGLEQWSYRLLLGEEMSARAIVGRYKESISKSMDVVALAQQTTKLGTQLLETDRVALILLNHLEKTEPAEVELNLLGAQGDGWPDSIRVAEGEELWQMLIHRQEPLSKDKMDELLDGMISAPLKSWIEKLDIVIIAPIVGQVDLDEVKSNDLLAFLVFGRKYNDQPYLNSEMNLIADLAKATVRPLENSRYFTAYVREHDKNRHLEADLVERDDRLAALNKVASDFISIASHELRTPLAQMKGYVDIWAAMSESGAMSSQQVSDTKDRIQRSIGKLENIVTDMLDVSQLDVKSMEMNFAQTKLESVLKLAIQGLQKALVERKIDLEFDEQLGSIPPMKADFKRLVQAINNILINGIKYTPDKGRIIISVTLLPTHNEQNPHVELIIADSGIGIDKKYHELIFEKFFRIGDLHLHSTGQTKFKGAGPGLGLPIAKGIIEAHNGRVWVESEGHSDERLPGTQFHIVLPVLTPDQIKADLEEMAQAGIKEKEERPPWLVG